MSCAIDEIDTIDDACREALAAKGITNSDQLFRKCETPEGRAMLARTTGLKEPALLKWVLQIELLCLPSLGPGYLNLLFAAGIESIDHLRGADAERLIGRLAAAKRNVRSAKRTRLPSHGMVDEWVAAAARVSSKFT